MTTESKIWFATALAALCAATLPANAQEPAPAPTGAAPETSAPATPPAASPPADPPAAAAAEVPGAAAPATTAPETRQPGAPPPAAAAPPVAAAAPRTNAAGVPVDEADSDDGKMGSHQLHFYGSAGYRAAFVRDEGFDPFSTDDVLNCFSLTIGRVLATDAKLSFGLGAGWDYGHSEAAARGSATTLDLHRLLLVPEARYHFARRLYGFGRAGAGIAFIDTTLAGANGGGEGVSNEVAFTVDPSLGVAWEALGEASGDSARPRAWLLADVGYLFTTKTDLTMVSDSGSPSRAETTSLGQLGASGLTFRVQAAVTY